MAITEQELIAASELPEIMNMADVARYLRIGRGTAYELARRKDFPAFRIGSVRGVRVGRSQFLEWVSQQGIK